MKFELFHKIINTSLYLVILTVELQKNFIDFEINEHEQDFTEFLQNELATLNELNIDK